MPLHDVRCKQCAAVEERMIPLADLDKPQIHACGGEMERVFFSFPYATVQADICYDSPIDGRLITTKEQRLEDLARSNCVEYDPEIKTDYMRRQKESDARLEKAIDNAVDSTIAAMPARKLERLTAELQGGMTVEAERRTGNPTATTGAAHG